MEAKSHGKPVPVPERITGALLDIDGTLVDSNDAHARAWVEAFGANHIEARFENVRTQIGKGADKLLPEIAGVSDESETGAQISRDRRRIFLQRYLPTLHPFPDARRLVERLKASGYRIVVASSAAEEELEELLEVADIADLVESTTSSDDADRSKPSPDIVCSALSSGGLNADEAVMIGDTPYDIEAATRAGVAVIALRSGGWHDDDLAGAAAIYDDTADLLAHFDESPLAPGAVKRA
jgi:HAD superfamily hydrolase (TIGR01549 family)